MDLQTMLVRLGLPKHSSAVFETLESTGPLAPSALGRASGLHRPALYRCLRALVTHGLVHVEKRGERQVYRAGERARIRELFTQTLEELRAEAPKPPQNPGGTIRHLTGGEGIATVFEDVITHCKRGETFFRYTSERNLEEVNSYLPQDYRLRRDHKRLERLVISSAESGTQKRKRLERFIKYLGNERDPFDHNAIELIYGARVAFIDLNTKESLIIENPTLAEFQKSIFRALYKRL